jgi:Domain of unknown function (DUF1707)
MCAPYRSPRPPGPPRRGRSRYVDTDLRVSDAERTEVADRLSKHYADGRLDQAEFNIRLDQAMGAKVGSDLAGLFADLPGTDATDVLVPTKSRRRPSVAPHQHRALILILLVAVVATVGEVWVRSNLSWLAVGLIVFLWLRASLHRRRR